MKASRRNFLKLAGLGGLALGARLALPRTAMASEEAPRLLLVCYMSGGWDQLLALDPRPTNVAKFSGNAPYAANGSGIHPAYETVNETWMDQVLSATGGTGVQQAGNLTFGPAVPPELLAHHASLCLVRGINMGTLTHEVGRRYFLTGRFPRGLQPVGSSLGTLVAGEDGAAKTLPNLAIRVEAYNDDSPAYASPMKVADAQDVRDLLRTLGAPLGPGAAAVDALEAEVDCRAEELDGHGLRTAFRAARQKAKTIVSGNAAGLFELNGNNPGPNEALFDALGIASNTDLRGGKLNAALAAQALTHGVAHAVTLELASGLDDHSDWATTHPQALRAAFSTLGNLIQYLKETPYMDTATATWDHTTLLVFSEFSRTPLLNGRDGRDHHLPNSCLVAGPGIRGDKVIGGTSDSKMTTRPVDLDTGAASDGGVDLRPLDVHKTLLESMGLGDVYLGNTPPNVVQAMLKA